MYKVVQINYDIRPVIRPDVKLNQKEYATKEMAEQAILAFAQEFADLLNNIDGPNGNFFKVKKQEDFSVNERESCARHPISILWYNYAPCDFGVDYELRTAVGWEIV